MITSFPTLRNNNNTAGIMKFFFVPVSYLLRSPDILSGKAIGAHAFVGDKTWLTGYFDNQNAVFDSKLDSIDKGGVYKTSFKALISDSSEEHDNLFCEMRCERYVLIIIDNNKIQRIIGTKDNGAEFSYNFSSNKKFSDLPEYSFEFRWESACYPPSTDEITDIC